MSDPIQGPDHGRTRAQPLRRPLQAVGLLTGAVGLAALLIFALPRMGAYKPYGTPLLDPRPAADFRLTGSDGKAYTLKSFRGKAVLIFFGFVNCPDVCPTTLAELSKVYQALTPAEQGRVQVLATQLVRIGLDRVVGYIPSLDGYVQGELETVPQFTAAEAKALWERGEAVILDVRAADEHQAVRIPGALNLHAGRVMKHLGRIPRDKPVVLHCLGGDRSSTAISALLAAGFTNVINLTGGIRAWQEHGFPTEKGEARQAVGA